MRTTFRFLGVLLLVGGAATLGWGMRAAAGEEAPPAERSDQATPPIQPAGPPPQRPAPPTLAVLSSLEKLRPEALPKGGETIAIRALRGECESAQVGIHAGGVARRVAPRLEGMLGAGVEARLHRVELVEVSRPSGPEGAAGRWPDPLVPAVDAYVGEARDAFPLRIPAGESRAILLEVCVARDAAPGERRSSLVLDMDGAPHAVELALRIEQAQIPTTASFPTSFGFSSRRAAFGHHGRAGTDEEIRQLDALYRTALLRHRISAHGGTMDPPPFRREGGKLQLDFTAYDAELAPFLEGRALPSGARATTTELRTHPGLRSDKERIDYWRAIVAHHRAKGWDALLFDYPHDEPAREELPPILERARLVKKADQRIRVLLTASLDPALVGPVDLWTPNLNCLYVKERPDEFCAWRAPLAAYRRAVAQGGLLWWYQSCSSHGCGEIPKEAAGYFRGWPSYMVDAPGTRARAMAWLAFAEEIGGELYWDTVYAYAPEGKPRDPWARDGLFAFGGNGDGTFFYPGTPAKIGGTRHVPVESLRLQHVRDGLEDYELLLLVAAQPGGAAVARAAARQVAASPYRVKDDPAALEAARARLLDFLAARTVRE